MTLEFPRVFVFDEDFLMKDFSEKFLSSMGLSHKWSKVLFFCARKRSKREAS